jgi:hypothetical protein
MMSFDKLDETNFILYAARHYDNAQCYDREEFYDDLKRFKYLKRLFVKYEESNELRERLILNHLIILYNVFNDAATPMLFLKLKGYYHYLKPFLILLGRLPNKVLICGEVIYTSDIALDSKIIETLRGI